MEAFGVLTLFVVGYLSILPAQLLCSRVQRVRGFATMEPWKALGFGEIAWGMPLTPRRELHPVSVVLALVLVAELTALGQLFLPPGVPGAGLLLALPLVASEVWPALWVPRSRRLRFDQHGVHLDTLRSPAGPARDRALLEARPLDGSRAYLAWEDLDAVFADGTDVVFRPRQSADVRYGPLPLQTATDVVHEAQGRLAGRSGPASEQDRARLAALQRIAESE